MVLRFGPDFLCSIGVSAGFVKLYVAVVGRAGLLTRSRKQGTDGRRRESSFRKPDDNGRGEKSTLTLRRDVDGRRENVSLAAIGSKKRAKEILTPSFALLKHFNHPKQSKALNAKYGSRKIHVYRDGRREKLRSLIIKAQ
jgi:hypothetical protein